MILCLQLQSQFSRHKLRRAAADKPCSLWKDLTPTVSAAKPATTLKPQDSEMMPVSNVQPQVTTQNVQSSAALAGAKPGKGILIQSGYRWLHALAAIGLLAISDAVSAVVFKRSTLLRLKSWIRKVIFEQKQSAEKILGKPSLEEEAAGRASQEMLILKREEKKKLIAVSL